jgi:ribosomal protein S18 acetylase RimI-like enzyme
MKARWMQISPQDFEAVVSLAVTVLKRSPMKTLGLLKRCLPGGPRDHAAVVVEDDEGSIIGYTLYRHNDKEIKIKHVAVHENDRRQGAAKSLLNWIIESYPDTKKLILADVSENNTAAQKLFASMGFKAQLVRNDKDDGDKYRFSFDPSKGRVKEKV